MTKAISGLIAALCLAGCAEVVEERESTFTYQGETYRAVIRTFETENGGFTKRYIYSRPHPVSCSVTDDLDCRSAIRISRTRAANR
ncbi:hypothetical protein [uncultured Tateyamaria sp.]|uniref:hypothetical protein n=1 Tax=uncultured Tateyamaria sp. TaxID=455651 RepID=UPI002606F48C|nr:hypothetical protein [uncultured Tateyamaria sp.]